MHSKQFGVQIGWQERDEFDKRYPSLHMLQIILPDDELQFPHPYVIVALTALVVVELVEFRE